LNDVVNIELKDNSFNVLKYKVHIVAYTNFYFSINQKIDDEFLNSLLKDSNYYIIKDLVIKKIKTKDYSSKEIRDFLIGKLSEEETVAFQEKVGAINAIIQKAEAEGLYSADMKWIRELSAEDIEVLEGVVEGVEPDFYHMSYDLFSNKVYSFIYLILFVALAFHLIHAMQSAFQTLGLNHNKYNKFIEGFSWVYAIIIALGFAIVPIYIMFLV
jgi:hypothetical protein